MKRFRRGPHQLVLLMAVGALALVAAPVAALLQVVGSARASVHHIHTQVEPPQEHLTAALEANAAGQTLLHRAAATSGRRRSELLSASIAMAETAAKGWTSYRAVALPLPGEQQLAERYQRDNDAAKELARAVMVPIIASDLPAPLPEEQVLAAESTRKDLIALLDLYSDKDEALLRSLTEQTDRSADVLRAGAASVGLAILIAGLIGMRVAGRVAADQRRRAESAAIDELETRVIRGLELVGDEASAFRLGAVALGSCVPGTPVAIVRTDVAGGRLSSVVGATACGVEDAAGCPALRSSGPLQFPDSSSLDACPTLARGATGPCSVTCMPISVAGADTGLVQLVGPVAVPPALLPAHHLVVRRVGERVTMLRAVAGLKKDAARDPLTSLMNRRSLEAGVAQLQRDAIPYTVAYADLDHFKQLNDEHGHDVGDQALRDFSRTLRDSLRPEDLVCRWGGEEFVVVLPGCSRGEGVDAMERVRSTLLVRSMATDGPTVTVSCGVAEATPGETFSDTTARADQALRAAKAAGRNRVHA